DIDHLFAPQLAKGCFVQHPPHLLRQNMPDGIETERKRKDKEEERRYSVLLLAVHANKNQYLRFLAASAFFLRFTLGFS
ncbi:MAG: hypothetical protein ACI4PD_04085, partial [Butyricicoccus sp.]